MWSLGCCNVVVGGVTGGCQGVMWLLRCCNVVVIWLLGYRGWLPGCYVVVKVL